MNQGVESQNEQASAPGEQPLVHCPAKVRWGRTLLLAFFFGMGYLVASQFDYMTYHALDGIRAGGSDAHRLFRVMGFVPTWILAAVLLGMIDWPDVRKMGWFRAMWRPGLLMLAVLAAGLVSEVLKILIRRERPEVNDGGYGLRSWLEGPFHTGGLATPSSHAAIAFAAAFMMCHLVPQGRWLWLALAAGCAVTRVLAQAHFVCDVYLSAVVSYMIVHLLWRQHLRNNPELGDAPPELLELKR